MVIVAVLAALSTGALLGVVVARVIRRLTVQMARSAAAERDATVRAAVDTVLAVAGDRLGQHVAAGGRELDLRGREIDRQVADMTGQLQRVGDLVTCLQRERAQQHGQLVEGLDQALRATAQLADTTQSLRQALASPKARGQWGERMADDVLRIAGFLEGVNYRKQTAVSGGTIPDFTFLLPRDLLLHMDVKFPVDNYLRFLEAGSDGERDGHRQAFLRDVRQRVKELAHRGYADPSTTVGYLLLFIPHERVYGFIHEPAPALAYFALGQKVVLCSPFTLFAVLGVVRQSVDSFLLERTSDEILGALTGFGAQWERFSEHVDKLGRQLGTVQGTYDELAGTRRRQLQKRLDALEVIRTSRAVPDPDGRDTDGRYEIGVLSDSAGPDGGVDGRRPSGELEPIDGDGAGAAGGEAGGAGTVIRALRQVRAV
ncbi:hypothetical protein BH18ACT4_BH18ACT4_10250 [soil metagenome]